MNLNSDQLKGKWPQFKGELKSTWGKFTDDDLRQIEGDYDKFVGKVQERYADKKDAVIKWAENWYQQRERGTVGAGSGGSQREGGQGQRGGQQG